MSAPPKSTANIPFEDKCENPIAWAHPRQKPMNSQTVFITHGPQGGSSCQLTRKLVASPPPSGGALSTELLDASLNPSSVRLGSPPPTKLPAEWVSAVAHSSLRLRKRTDGAALLEARLPHAHRRPGKPRGAFNLHWTTSASPGLLFRGSLNSAHL